MLNGVTIVVDSSPHAVGDIFNVLFSRNQCRISHVAGNKCYGPRAIWGPVPVPKSTKKPTRCTKYRENYYSRTSLKVFCKRSGLFTYILNFNRQCNLRALCLDLLRAPRRFYPALLEIRAIFRD